MNAVVKPAPALPTSTVEAQFEAMTLGSLDAVVQVELLAYTHPWSRGNFADSLKAGYQAQLLTAGSGPATVLLGYFVAMKGVDEVHLLNITVAPEYQRQGWARIMLDALAIWARGQGAQWLWLEVRISNARAKAVYERYGFHHVGLRRSYYPSSAQGTNKREDALVMSFAL
jgi:ribosomal-protein-alanine N-acetyltransferase